MKVAIVRGAFLNRYEMQFFEPLTASHDMTAFASLKPFHDSFAFPVVKLPCPMDVPDFPFKMPVLNRMFTDAHYLFGLEGHLRGFDLAHTAETYFHYTQQCLNAKRKGYVKKVIATVLENIPFNNESIHGRKAFKKRAREELDHIIALTTLTRDVLIQEGTDPSKITVIGHFIDTERFKPGKKRRKHPELTVMFAGRLETYKGVYDLVSAAELLVRDTELEQIPFRFRMVGDGSEKRRLLNRVSAAGLSDRFEFVSVPYGGMPGEYGKADIYVAPSKSTPTWKEQYNTSLLEAQASGLPIVTTRSGGIPENVGNAAVMINEGDVPALARALKSFITDVRLRAEYGKRARDRAVHVHDKAIGARKLDELYRSLF